MNVFILDRDIRKSAQMLDDAHLKAQINETCQILMANYNHKLYPNAKIEHINHPVTKFYANKDCLTELVNYGYELVIEYRNRFEKTHQNEFFLDEYVRRTEDIVYICGSFAESKTYVNGSMTDNIDSIRNYIMTKPHTRPLIWTNREKPDWWKM